LAGTWQRVNVVILLLVLFALLAVIGMLAAGVRGGPLDPPGSPSETDGVRLPGTPIDAPFQIVEPGHYYLTRNITIPAQGIGVEIIADDVTLDLGGFTIDGPGGDDTGIHVGGGSHVRVYNGIVTGAETGVDVSGFDVRISDVTVSGASVGFRLIDGAVLENCKAVSNDVGVAIDGNATVRECAIRFSDNSGIVVSGGGDYALIEGSTIKDNNFFVDPSDAGIRVFFGAHHPTIRGNDFGNNQVADVKVGGSATTIIDNVLDCPTSIVIDGSAADTYAPVNTSDPHTNTAPGTC
jgi:hypothetical protein